MKILFLVSDLFDITGGIQVFNNYFVKAMAKLGYEISIVSMNDTKKLRNPLYCQLSNFSPCGRYRYPKKPLFIINTFWQVFHFKPDVILCGHVNFSALCMLINWLFRIPYFTVAHGVDVWKLNWLKLSGLKNSSKILSVSRFTKNKILKQLQGYEEKDIAIIPNTFDPQKFKPKPKPKHLIKKLMIEQDDKVLLTIARLVKSEQYKGYDKVIIALNSVVKELSNVKFIIGGIGDDVQRIKNLIRSNGLEEKVFLIGFIPDQELPDYYNLCDVFVMPSKKEGFGIVYLEALACGKPVICGNKDGSVDPVLGGETGILVDPDDIHEIKDAIIRVLKGDVNKKLLDREYLRRRTIKEYGVETFNERVKEVIENVRLDTFK